MREGWGCSHWTLFALGLRDGLGALGDLRYSRSLVPKHAVQVTRIVAGTPGDTDFNSNVFECDSPAPGLVERDVSK